MRLFADQLVRSPGVVDVVVDALENFVCVIVGHEDDPQRRSITGNRWRKLRGLPEIVPPYEIAAITSVRVEQFIGVVVGYKDHVGLALVRTACRWKRTRLTEIESHMSP